MLGYCEYKYFLLGNGHIRHLHKNFVDWSSSDWVRRTGMDTHFSMSEGILTIKDTGIYFVYAQVSIIFLHYFNSIHRFTVFYMVKYKR